MIRAKGFSKVSKEEFEGVEKVYKALVASGYGKFAEPPQAVKPGQPSPEAVAKSLVDRMGVEATLEGLAALAGAGVDMTGPYVRALVDRVRAEPGYVNWLRQSGVL